MQIFQFTAIQNAALLYRLLKKTLRQDSIIVFDLEDTLSDMDKEKSKCLKKWGRLELTKFVQSYPVFFKSKKIGIRTNRIKSLEFENDLEIIAKISKILELFCIIGPKIESKQDIDEFINNLQNNKICYKTFIPIIETTKGMLNLFDIVQHKNVSYAIYGHYDYSLDSSNWPFFEQDEIEFWNIADNFIKIIEANKISYIHPPVPYFLNEKLSCQICLELQKRCCYPFGIMTVNSLQTEIFNKVKKSPLTIENIQLKSASWSFNEKIAKAIYVKELFFKKKRNFVIDKKRFFTPHEYISALKFLEKSNA